MRELNFGPHFEIASENLGWSKFITPELFALGVLFLLSSLPLAPVISPPPNTHPVSDVEGHLRRSGVVTGSGVDSEGASTSFWFPPCRFKV